MAVFFKYFLILNFNFFLKINVIDLIEIILILSYFIVDMTVTFVLRIYKYGINSFKAHRDHAYQILFQKK